MSTFPGLLILFFALPTIIATDFFFYWPTTSSQCDVVNLSWANGKAPFTAWIVPIYGQPFIYSIPDSAYAYGVGNYPISLQLAQGQEYVVVMSDGNGVGTGGSSQIHIVGQSNSTSCLATSSDNITSLDFTFTVSGQAVQCTRGFEMSWSGGKENGPYTASIIPLDQTFDTYDVTLETAVEYESDWVLNMTAGTRFSVMMNSKLGYGRGGVAGIYQVSNSSDTSCVDQVVQPSGTWPEGLATNTIDQSTLAVTHSAKVGNSKLSKGAIAGVVIGILAVLALVGLVLFFLLRRRRNRRRKAMPYKDGNKGQLDLVDKPDEGAHHDDRVTSNDNPIIEPYHQEGPSSPGGYRPVANNDNDEGTFWSEPNTATSAGFAGLGAGAGIGARAALIGEGREGGPGMAGPLPLKSTSGRVPPRSASGSGTSSGPGIGSGSPQPPPPNPASAASGTNNLKQSEINALLRSSSYSPSPQNHNHNHNQRNSSQNQNQMQMQIANPDDNSTHSTLTGSRRSQDHHRPQSQSQSQIERDSYGNGGRRGSNYTYRRHADAGRVVESNEIVDLPPLYTEVPRDNDSLSLQLQPPPPASPYGQLQVQVQVQVQRQGSSISPLPSQLSPLDEQSHGGLR